MFVAVQLVVVFEIFVDVEKVLDVEDCQFETVEPDDKPTNVRIVEFVAPETEVPPETEPGLKRLAIKLDVANVIPIPEFVK